MTESSPTVSDAVKEMALDLEREYHIRPLEADEERPADYYSVGHYTGRGYSG
jgi:hypothetical protein